MRKLMAMFMVLSLLAGCGGGSDDATSRTAADSDDALKLTATPKSSGTMQPLSGIIYAGGQFVAVGAGGVILTSPDGTSWTARAAGITGNLLHLAYGGGRFVVLGDNLLVTSSDGINWTSSAGVPGGTSRITYGGGQFVSVGDAGTIMTSADGTGAWLLKSSGTTAKLSGITYGSSQFVAVGENGTLLTSADGSGWTRRFSGTMSRLSAITFAAGKFVAVGDNVIITSADGMNWTSRPEMMSLQGVAFGGGQFVAIGNNGVYTSTDGIVWTSDYPATMNRLSGITYGAGQFMIAGEAGTILGYSQATKIITYPTVGAFGLNVLSEKTDYPQNMTFSLAAILGSKASLGIRISADGDLWLYAPLSASGWSASNYDPIAHSRFFTATQTGAVDVPFLLNASGMGVTGSKVTLDVYENGSDVPTWTKTIKVR